MTVEDKDTLLEIRDLEVQYKTDEGIVRAVNSINLSLRKGETLGLVGETGAGKTTTVLSLLRLLPEYIAKITKGSIRFKDIDILAADKKTMREIRGKQISMIFQDPMTSLNPIFRVGFQIAEVISLHNRNLSKSEVEKKVDEILETVGIPAARKREFPHQFSGGMKQRVMIAIAIACEPDLLIADEPTSALDVTIQAQVIKMMRQLRNKLKTSVILITHDLGLVANFCDSVAIMYAGEIIEYGTLEEVFDEEKPHHPYTAGLFGSIPNIENQAARLTPITGLMPNPTRLPNGCKFHTRCPYKKDICLQGKVPVRIEGNHKVMCHEPGPIKELVKGGDSNEEAAAGM